MESKIADIALIFKKNKTHVLQKWLDLVLKNNIISEESELSYFKAGFGQIVDDFIEYLSRRDFDAYYAGNRICARQIAYNDISYSEFIKAFHLFEDSYSEVLEKNIPAENLLAYLSALDKLHHNSISVVSEEYFQIKDNTVFALAKLAELRDPLTMGHLERTREHSILMARRMGLSTRFQDLIHKVGPLHDIGKVGIPDRILLKPAPLTDDEFEEMKKHTLYGGQTIDAIIGDQKISRGYLLTAKEICLYHHEKFDGSGYPEGLEGETIPLSARIFALADSYDAIVSKRPYKEAIPHKKALELLEKDSGTQFDPEIVKIFLKFHTDFDKINKQYQ